MHFILGQSYNNIMCISLLLTSWWRCSTGLWSQWPVEGAPLWFWPRLVCGCAGWAPSQSRCTHFQCRLASLKTNNMTDEEDFSGMNSAYWFCFTAKIATEKQGDSIWYNSLVMPIYFAAKNNTNRRHHAASLLHKAHVIISVNGQRILQNISVVFRNPVHSQESVSASISVL